MNTWLILGWFFLAAGFVLAVMEFLTPGFGVPGISGMICFVLGILLTAKTLDAAVTEIVMILVVLAVLVTLCLIFVNGRKRKRFVLHDSLSAERGKITEEDLCYLVGKQGIAATDLRPSGVGKIDGVEFDVRAEGHFVRKGTPIRITRVSGSTLCVLAIQQEAVIGERKK